jgi:FkbM family methyltransferase
MRNLGTRLWSRHSDIGIYQRLKGSRLYDLYFGIRNKAVIENRDAELEFYRALLQGLLDDDLAYDIGANIGDKTDLFLRLGARVIAVDPDPTNQAILQRRFLSYRLQKKSVTIVGKAVSDQNAVQTMWVDEPGSAKNTLASKWVSTLRSDTERFGSTLSFAQEQQVETITLEEMFRRHGKPFFIKIDVEGYEPNVLAGLREPVPMLQFEVNLPEFVDEGVRCVQTLRELDARSEFNFSRSLAREGLAVDSWIDADAMIALLRSRQERSIEVFCRTALRRN